MFETMLKRAAQLARTQADARRREIAERLDAELPRGVLVGPADEGVRLSGRGLVQRVWLDPRLRALIAEALR